MEWLIAACATVIVFLGTILSPFIVNAPTAPIVPIIEHLSQQPEPQKKEEVRVLFVGDMMFDRSIRVAMDQKGGDFIFSCIDPVLRTGDLVVGNLEGPITDNPSKSVGTEVGGDDNYTFTFPTYVASLLASHNIRLVSIGNNHIMNFSREGLTQTKYYLGKAGVEYFGDPDALEADKVARIEINGIPFSFVNWSDWTSDKTDHTVAQVREETAAGRATVVYAHWGEEYVEPPARVRTLAHQFVDAGAVLVIGSHPHIVQEHETYHGANIYYSLGNFIFDQYWEDKVRNGLLVAVTFNKEGVAEVEEIPTRLEKDRTTCPHTNIGVASSTTMSDF